MAIPRRLKRLKIKGREEALVMIGTDLEGAWDNDSEPIHACPEARQL